MNPKIDVTIIDSHGDYATLVSDNFEPYEVYVNNERFCTSEQLDELGSENTKLRERIEYLEEELRKQGSAAGKFMAMARTYQENNEKLREYIEWLEDLALSDPNHYKDTKFLIETKRRELGIEIDDSDKDN